MAYNKVVYDGNTLIDLTQDDVTPSDVKSGVYFHGADGVRSVGTMTETDPVFSASPASGITSSNITNWNKAEENVQSDWSQSDNTKDDYIKNKPTIPTVNNATLTIQKNGTNVATFTANASSNTTANITVPTSASDVSAIPTTAFATTDSATHCNFSTYGTAKAYVPDMRYIAFWNGAYDSSGNSNLTRCASGAILGTNTVVDYITSKGTSSSWYYRKWNSGVIEAVFHGSVSYGTMSASGQLYRSTNNAVAIPSGIFTVMPQRTEITINNASTVVVCATAVATSTTNVNVQVWRSTNSASSIDATIRCTYTP